jgi:cobalamin biosynthesis protein CobD/CbiB
MTPGELSPGQLRRDPLALGGRAALQLTLLTAALIMAAAAATPILTLPLSTVIMVVLVALLFAYHLTAAHRASGQPGH